jgi:GDPmannose 4,6-dehydratase
MKNVIITGVTGQDGSNMADHLINDHEDIHVYGMSRRVSIPNNDNIKHLLSHPRFTLFHGDLTDSTSINSAVKKYSPDYFLNFAANSYVGCSWTSPIHVWETNTTGLLRCLEAIRCYAPKCRFYSAGSSEEMGDVDYSPQDLKHPIKPRSPYGASKAACRHLTKVYRESYNLFAIHSILFNHEGLRRGEEFVTRKITKGVAKIKKSIKNNENIIPIRLGNVNSRRDWSDSEDFMRGVWMMMQQDEPKEHILASGETHSIKDFVTTAFAAAGIPGLWSGEGMDEKFRLFQENTVLAEIDNEFYRPAEVELLWGDSTSARKELGWEPQISFDKLVERMVHCDLALNDGL